MKADKDIERRCYQCELRAVDADSRVVEGYAAVYNSDSVDMGFTELIMPGAFDGVIEKSDVFALLNHNDERGVLARSKYGKGSLSLELDDNGLKYRFEAPNTVLGDELLENLKRGDVDSSSFAFTVDQEEWINEGTAQDEKWLRKIIKVRRLYDVSPVYTPAYPATSCFSRALDCLEAKKSEVAMMRQQSMLDEIENKY